jgi:cell wall-associated NlpC family hydrolase
MISMLERSSPSLFLSAMVGSPYVANGRSRHGIDCWGMVVLWYDKVLGVTLPDWKRSDMSRRWVVEMMTGEMKQRMRWLEEPCDHAIAVGQRGDTSHHAGIYYKGAVIHAMTGAGVVVRPAALAPYEFGGAIRYGVPQWLE